MIKRPQATSPNRSTRRPRFADLGFFSLKVFRGLDLLGAYFLSRCRHGLNFYDPATGQNLDLIGSSKPMAVLMAGCTAGEEKVRLRQVIRTGGGGSGQ